MRMTDVTELRQTMMELLEDIRELLARLEEESSLENQVQAMRLRVDHEIEALR